VLTNSCQATIVSSSASTYPRAFPAKVPSTSAAIATDGFCRLRAGTLPPWSRENCSPSGKEDDYPTALWNRPSNDVTSLKKLKLSKVRITDASFLYTEPHSRRIKVKITIQDSVAEGVLMQQSFEVTYVVNYQQWYAFDGSAAGYWVPTES
jgi:NMD3 family